MTRAERVRLHGCDSLPTLDGVMPGLEAAGGIQISDSSSLARLGSGFPRLAKVTGHLAIFGLPALAEADGFAALEAVGDLDIYSNPALTDVRAFSGLKTANLVRVYHNPVLARVDGFDTLQALGDDDDTKPALVVVENGVGITMTAFGALEHGGGWAALQRLDAPALCASKLVAKDETPCYCGDADDACYDHADVVRELKQVRRRRRRRRRRRHRGDRAGTKAGAAVGLGEAAFCLTCTLQYFEKRLDTYKLNNTTHPSGKSK